MADNELPTSSPITVPGETVIVTAKPAQVDVVQPPIDTTLLTPQPITPVPDTQGTIRNVIQTVQEREVIKTAPDIVVYLDGLPYLINSFLNDPISGTEFVVVNFNDHVQNFQASYDTDNLIPTGSIGLSVPNHQKALYQAPGGNNVIIPMMEVQVFAKGYFLSPRGNTVYYRVFKGLTSHVTHTDNGKTLEISIQIRGILRFMELMQIDVSPALVSTSNRGVTALTSQQANLDPYQIIADVFLRGCTFEGFQLNTISGSGQTVQGSDFAQSVKADYITKWQSILNGIRADTHIMGYIGDIKVEDINAVTKPSAAVGSVDPEKVAAGQTKASRLKESDNSRFTFVNLIRGYTPDFGVSTVNLLNGKIVSRLERIRHVLTIIGFEGFQDINGEIIFKAPLYNLDVTNLSTAPSDAQKTGASQADGITVQNNPFIVYLSEIEQESETEDEAAIRCTRMSVQGGWTTRFQVNDSGTLREVTSHIDIPKLARFGLREEPARTVGWIENGNKVLQYAYAVHEMVRQNRGYRTYQFTMPMRPELKLGFPMYVPHKDFYGYIKGVAINYVIGGPATMSVMLDTIRKRPMFPSLRPLKGSDQQKETILTTQPNLVMQWTQPPQTAGKSTTSSARPSTTGDTQSNDPSVNFQGNPATQTHTTQEPTYAEQIQMANYRKNVVGTDWSTRADTTTHSFRVQNDRGLDGKSDPFFTRDRWLNPRTAPNGVQVTGIDMTYLQAIRTLQPFTDEKGYEVISVFPLGRWKSLHEAIKETREGSIVDYVNPQQQQTLKQIDALLFAGLGTPSSSSASVLLDQFKQLTSEVAQNASFELTYTKPTAPGQDTSLTQLQQPGNKPNTDLTIATQTEDAIAQKVDLFIQGTPQPLPATKQELEIVTQNTDNDTTFSDVLSKFKSL